MSESNNNNTTSTMERLKSIEICSVICLVVIGAAIGLGLTAQTGSSNGAAEQATVDKAIVTEDDDAEANFFESDGADMSAAGSEDEDGEESDADKGAQNEMGTNDAGTSDNLTSETSQGTSRANTAKSVTNTGSSQEGSITSASHDNSAGTSAPPAPSALSSAEPSNGSSNKNNSSNINTDAKPSSNASVNNSSAKPESSTFAPAHMHSWYEYETIIEQGRYETVDKGTTRPMLYVYDVSGNLSNQFLPGNVKEAQDWADMVGGRVESVQVKNTVTNWYSPKYEYGKKCSCGEKIAEGTRGGTKTCIGGYA